MDTRRGETPRIVAIALVAIALIAGRATAQAPPKPAGRSLADLAAAARAGDRIALGEGTYEGGVTLPPSVSLVGLGPGRTIIEGRGRPIGLAVEGGSDVEVAGLTIRGAGRTNLQVRGTSGASVRRVHASGAVSGIAFEGVNRGRVEDSVVSGNRYGIVASGGRDVAIVNCSMVGNTSLGLSLPTGERTVAFNNVIADGSVGVYLGEGLKDARVDHNLYFTMFVGKQAGQVGRKSIGDWHALTALDGRSVRLPATFRDDGRPSSVLEWDPARASTSDWGVAEFAGVKAPPLDPEGKPRVGRPDVGAFESPIVARSSADGTFTIRGDAGVKSAGVFEPGGRLVAYLFHDLPLLKGDHRFRLPSRDFEGKPIPAGAYEVRVVESDLEWAYLGPIGDTGAAWPATASASVNPVRSSFDERGILVMQQGWSEDGANLRGYDAATGRWLWAFEGRTDLAGLTIGRDGFAYSLRPAGDRGQVTRIDPKTGKVAPTEGWPGGQVMVDGVAKVVGFVALGDRLYFADAGSNRVRSMPIAKPSIDREFSLAGPVAMAADESRGVLWTLDARGMLVGSSTEGRKLAEAGPIPSPMAIAARDGRVAVASKGTGKVHLFDVADLGSIKPIRTIGRGDGPHGPIVADRFAFQSSAGDEGSHVGLAIGPKGDLAVTERNRLVVFGLDGRATWSTFGVFGNESRPSRADPRRVYDTDGRVSFLLDETRATWKPEATRRLPKDGEFLGDFAAKGGVFGVVLVPNAMAPSRDLVVFKLDGPAPRPVSALIRDPGTRRYLTLRDANRDGSIDLRDQVATTPSGDGPSAMFGRDSTLLADGSVLTPGYGSSPWASILKPSEVDSEDGPGFDIRQVRDVPRPAEGLVSPYSLRPEADADVTAATPTLDGGLIANVRIKSSPGGVGLFHNAGTDVVRFDSAGRPRWIHPLERHQGIEGLATVGPVTIVGVGVTSEVLAMDVDGLGLGSFGNRASSHYEGYFLDHPGAVRAYKGHDGRAYALIADNYAGRHHWWRLERSESIIHGRFPITIAPERAAELAARPPARLEDAGPAFHPHGPHPPARERPADRRVARQVAGGGGRPAGHHHAGDVLGRHPGPPGHERDRPARLPRQRPLRPVPPVRRRRDVPPAGRPPLPARRRRADPQRIRPGLQVRRDPGLRRRPDRLHPQLARVFDFVGRVAGSDERF